MSGLEQRRHFLQATLCTLLAACGGGGSGTRGDDPGPVAAKKIDDAVAQLDRLVADLMTSMGVPGMAVAVVRGEQTIYAKGFGTRLVGTQAAVDADTVFQLASVSKSVGATAVAHVVGTGEVAWDTPVRNLLPWFALSDPDVTQRVTIGDLYAHRSGLPEHIGDRLEDMGYDQREVLEHLRYVPLDGFRSRYNYTNFALTAGAVAAATAAGTDWATLSERAIYGPLGMSRTSSRFTDFAARDNRVTGHRRVDGQWQVAPVRVPDAQGPAASVTSSVNDLAKWMTMVMGNGIFAGRGVVDAAALAPAVSPQIESSPAAEGRPAGYYGYGFNVGKTAAGRKTLGHSGAFALGAATAFKLLPSTGVGIVCLTNGYPLGIPEILTAQFSDLLEYGAIQHDYASVYVPYFENNVIAPEGSLVGVPRPTAPTPPSRSLANYAGTYRNDFHGPLEVALAGDALQLTLGPTPLLLPLAHWDADVFTFTLDNENATPGTISKATFVPGSVTLEYYDRDHMGVFML
jgi:CubicO group peptidase (beta-lactamase class C family)